MGNKQLQYIYCPISRSKGNQTMKFGQLMEYNMRSTFLKNHIQNMGGTILGSVFDKMDIVTVEIFFDKLVMK